MLERVQQDYKLADGSIATIWRGKGGRGRKPHYYCAITHLGDVVRDIQRFATWDEAETWMRKQVEALRAQEGVGA